MPKVSVAVAAITYCHLRLPYNCAFEQMPKAALCFFNRLARHCSRRRCTSIPAHQRAGFVSFLAALRGRARHAQSDCPRPRRVGATGHRARPASPAASPRTLPRAGPPHAAPRRVIGDKRPQWPRRSTPVSAVRRMRTPGPPSDDCARNSRPGWRNLSPGHDAGPLFFRPRSRPDPSFRPMKRPPPATGFARS